MEENINNETVKINVLGEEKVFPKGIKIYEAFKDIIDSNDNTYLAVRYNNMLKSFGHRLKEDGNIEFIDENCDEGREIYIRTLCFILSKACDELDWKERIKLTVNYQIANGMFCTIEGKHEISEELLEKIEEKIRQIVESNLEIRHITMSRDEAIEFYEKTGSPKGRLQLDKPGKEEIVLYYCEDYFNYFYGIMPLSTGKFKDFALKKFQNGFILVYPEYGMPGVIPEFKENNKLYYALNEYDSIYKLLGVSVAYQFNHKVKEDQKDLILLSEALHEKKISDLAKKIVQKENVKMILIAGPSSSGKTTFAGKLKNALRLRGLKPITISVDNYFVERKDTPRDENGEYDFESIESIDLKLFNSHIQSLIDGEEIEVPTFDFTVGTKRYLGNKLKLGKDEIIIMEGIHCLNDKLTESIPNEYKFKVYISALTVLSLDYFNRISTTDTRLLRRIIRDHRTRGYNAEQTLLNWKSVRRGERKNIFPYQETADFMFNSSVFYELGALKDLVIPLLLEIPKTSKVYFEAQRLIDFLEYFESIERRYIPNNSLLREFIGGSVYEKNYLEELDNEMCLKIEKNEKILDNVKTKKENILTNENNSSLGKLEKKEKTKVGLKIKRRKK